MGKSAAFIAANAGFDVWLGNNRGNKYSLMHKKYDPAYDEKFWDHSFIEYAKYDIPSWIEHIKF